MKITDNLSPHHEERRDDKTPKYLILHYTGTESVDAWVVEALEIKVSTHYLIDDDGRIIRIVPEDKRAWHAGVSHWEGEEDINSASIGIEIQNGGHAGGLPDFPEAQIESVMRLSQDIIKRHNMRPAHVLAHSDIAPTRKTDPGEHFPWEVLAKNDIGLWVEAHKKNTDPVEDDLTHLLVEYGYDPNIDYKTLITAFQRHFEPQVFATPEKVGAPNLNTVHILKSLLKMKTNL